MEREREIAIAKSFPRKVYKVAERLSVDDNGPVNSGDCNNNHHHYWFIFKDVRSGRKLVYLSRNVWTTEEYWSCLRRVICYFARYGHTVMTIRSDDKTIFNSEEMKDFLTKNGLASGESAPYRQFQNTVEKDISRVLLREFLPSLR